jgi:hypothetical protein
VGEDGRSEHGHGWTPVNSAEGAADGAGVGMVSQGGFLLMSTDARGRGGRSRCSRPTGDG